MKTMDADIIKPEESHTNSTETDYTKVKIRHILAQRFKKYGTKKIVGLILLAVICFGAGLLTDRLVMRHENGRNFYGKSAIQRNISGKYYGNKRSRSYGNSGTQQPSSNNNSKQSTQKSTQNVQ